MKTLATAHISILDLAKVAQGKSVADAYAHTRALAQHAERLGYRRFWLAEHHNLEGIASAATSILIAHVAEHTRTIRVGSGGIMLPNHAPLVIAEQFGTLATLFPNRIDLGLGRAPGTDQVTMRALRRDSPLRGEDFGEMIQELERYFAPEQPGQKIRAIPGAGIDVPLYILGSSLYSADLAARLGRPYAFAGHFAPALMLEAFELYRARFQPSRHLAEPYVMAGVPVIAADTDAHAEFLSSSLKQAFLGMVRGQRRFSAPPVPDMDAIWSPAEKAAVQSMLGLLVTGGSEKVRRDLDGFISVTGADELIITSDTFDPADRMRSYGIIAQARSLAAVPQSG